MRILTPVVATAFFAACCVAATHSAEAPPATISPALAERLKAIVPADGLEASIVQPPVDPEALAGQAVSLAQLALRATEPEKARDLRRRAYAFGAAATEAKARNLLLAVVMAEIQADGSVVPGNFSANRHVSDIVADAEAKFAHGDMDGALAGYRRALELDPKCYRAMLFGGDVFFSQKDYAQALEWFDRAIATDRAIETAHRYRADVLMRLGRVDEAGASYVDAFVASPFASLPTTALSSWIRHKRLTLNRVNSSFFMAELAFKNGEPQLGIDQEHSTTVGLAYGVARIGYIKEHHLAVENYRQSLAEETDALHTALEVAQELLADKAPPADLVAHAADVQRIIQIEREGLLEALVFFDRPNNEVAQDYAAYRAQHHDQLARYIHHIWLGLP